MLPCLLPLFLFFHLSTGEPLLGFEYIGNSPSFLLLTFSLRRQHHPPAPPPPLRHLARLPLRPPRRHLHLHKHPFRRPTPGPKPLQTARPSAQTTFHPGRVDREFMLPGYSEPICVDETDVGGIGAE